MAGEAEENVVTPEVKPVPKEATNVTPSPVPAAPPNVDPDKVAADKAAADKVIADKAAADAAAAQAAKEAEQEEDTPNPDQWKEQYIQFDDPTAQSVVNMLNEAGMSPVEANAIFEDALKHDDLSKVKWDVLEARLGKDKANLAKIGITDYYNREYSKNTATTKMAHEVMGGEENWKTVANWVKRAEKADPSRKAEFDELRQGLNHGGRYAKQAAADLRKLFEADPKNSGLGNSKIISGDAPPKGGLQPMSRAEYTAELSKHGDRIKPELYAELRERRRLGMAAERAR